MNNDDNLDLLDLNDDADSTDALPEAAPFAAPRPKKPWLLMAIGVLIIILATYVIIRIVGDDSNSTMEVDLDAPAVIVDGVDSAAPLVVGPSTAPTPANVAAAPQPTPQVAPQPVQKPAPVVQPAPQPVAQPAAQNTTPGVPVRVIEDRKEVTFNPDKPAAQPAAKPVAKPAAKAQPARNTQPAKSAQRAQNTTRTYAWYAQIGSYSTRALAESGQRQLRASHQNLFNGHQFVILAAVLPNGTTAYRLRVGFNAAADANNFCRNAKADGLECYVTK